MIDCGFCNMYRHDFRTQDIYLHRSLSVVEGNLDNSFGNYPKRPYSVGPLAGSVVLDSKEERTRN